MEHTRFALRALSSPPYFPRDKERTKDRGKEGRAARNIIVLLHEHYQENKQSIPEEYRVRSETFDDAVKDYISGMTDQYAIRVAESIDPGISSVFSGRLL